MMDINTEVTLPLPTAASVEPHAMPALPIIEPTAADEPNIEGFIRALFLITPGMPEAQPNLLTMNLADAREHFERTYLQLQLAMCNGKVGQLAKRVGMERTHLYRKLLLLGLREAKIVDVVQP